MVQHLGRYCLAALAACQFPLRRADGQEFGPEEPVRRGRRWCRSGGIGQNLLMFWPFLPGSLKLQPCPFCWCSQENMGSKLAEASVSNRPWEPKTLEQLEGYCAGVEHRCDGTENDWFVIAPALQYDKRSQGNRGRCLAQTLPELGLQSGDRLEPSEVMPDTGVVAADLAVPVPMVFWRSSADEPVRHRNPLWDSALGITPEIICIDVLHTWCLGIFAGFCSRAVWKVLELNPFGVSNLFTKEERQNQSLQLLGTCLQEFYHNTEKKWTQVDDLKIEMFGKEAAHHRPHEGPPMRRLPPFFAAFLGAKVPYAGGETMAGILGWFVVHVVSCRTCSHRRRTPGAKMGMHASHNTSKFCVSSFWCVAVAWV